ncbi:MAG: HepT-like ribonuclease domain-containing protein [Thermoleophilia bacterium]
MTKDQRVYLAQILEAAERIAQYTREGKDAFLADKRTQDAVARNFQVIGEASKRVSAEYRKDHPQVPRRGLAGFRDVLIHQYDSIDVHEMWWVVELELPPLVTSLASLLPPLDQLEREIAGEDAPRD